MRFNYVKYDEESVKLQEKAKELCEALEKHISQMPASRPQSLALTALEEVYMWAGKAIRDLQVMRGSQVDHVAERSVE